MKKVMALLLAMLMVLGVAAGCTSEETSTTTPGTEANDPGTNDSTPAEPADPGEPASADVATGLSGSLKFWSFSTELETMAVAFRKNNPDVTIEYSMTPDTDDQFKRNLLNAIMSGNTPDVVGLEAAFVREFVENGSLLTINDLRPLAQANEQYDYTLGIGTDPNGDLKALSYQSAAGGLFYRRSLANEFFGTDDPAAIQELVKDMDTFTETAGIVHEKSGGSAYMVPSFQDFCNPYFNIRSQPWIVDNALYIDPVALDLFDICKEYRDNEYEARAQAWSDGWFASMSDELTDAAGNEMKVFSYFLSTWGLPYVLMPNSGGENGTGGDWALTAGPLEYAWGGSFLGIMESATDVELAKEFIKFCTLDKENLSNWALGVYTNEYLKEIDPQISSEVSHGSGDLINSESLVQELIPQFDDAETSAFLGGQNGFAVFAGIAENTTLTLLQGTDATIQPLFISAVGNYVNGIETKEEAIASFTRSVQEALPDLNW